MKPSTRPDEAFEIVHGVARLLHEAALPRCHEFIDIHLASGAALASQHAAWLLPENVLSESSGPVAPQKEAYGLRGRPVIEPGSHRVPRQRNFVRSSSKNATRHLQISSWERLIELRERRRWTQTGLTRELRAMYGFPFHQQTVRPLDAMLLRPSCETAAIHAKVRDALGAYTQREDGAGQPVGEGLVAKVDVEDGTYERARHPWSRGLRCSRPDWST